MAKARSPRSLYLIQSWVILVAVISWWESFSRTTSVGPAPSSGWRNEAVGEAQVYYHYQKRLIIIWDPEVHHQHHYHRKCLLCAVVSSSSSAFPSVSPSPPCHGGRYLDKRKWGKTFFLFSLKPHLKPPSSARTSAERKEGKVVTSSASVGWKMKIFISFSFCFANFPMKKQHWRCGINCDT